MDFKPKKWPCAVCGKFTLDPKWWMRTTLCEYHRRKRAPWPDYEGNEIFEGDTITHPSGQSGVVILHRERDSDHDKWVVDYGDGIESRLCLQIGGRGQATAKRTI